MLNSELTPNAQRILEETGGDIYYADLFLELAQVGAEKIGRNLHPKTIEIFRKEVAKCRNEWEKRQKFYKS